MRDFKFTIFLFLLSAKLQIARAGFHVPGRTNQAPKSFATKLQVRNESPFAICNVTVKYWDHFRKKDFEWDVVGSDALSTNQSFTYTTLFAQTWAVGFADCGGHLRCESYSGNPFDERELHDLDEDDQHDPVLIHIHAHTIAPKYGPIREEIRKLFSNIEDVKVDVNKQVKVDYTYSINSESDSSTGRFQCRWTGPDIPPTPLRDLLNARSKSMSRRSRFQLG